MSSRHDGISCDACNQKGFRMRRYKCLVCYDYDLCGSCFDKHCETNKHSKSHPMQCLIPTADHKLFYSGEQTESCYVVHSFTCPLCGQLGFTETSFSQHVFQKHSNSESVETEVTCPLCVTHQNGDNNKQTLHLIRHLKATHNFTPPSEKDGQKPSSPASPSTVALDHSAASAITNRFLPPLHSRHTKVASRNRTTDSGAKVSGRSHSRNGVHGSNRFPLNAMKEMFASRSSQYQTQLSADGSNAVRSVERTSTGRNSHNDTSDRSLLSVPSTVLRGPQRGSTTVHSAGSSVAVDSSSHYTGEQNDGVNVDGHHGSTTMLESLEDLVSASSSSTVTGAQETHTAVESDQVQAAQPHSSISGDMKAIPTDSTVPLPFEDKENLKDVLSHDETVSARPKDEFDHTFSAFLSELAWRSLCLSEYPLPPHHSRSQPEQSSKRIL